MAQVDLKLKSASNKYGLVTITDSNGNFVSNHRITAEELDELNASGNGIPKGVTEEEWTSGRAMVYHVDLDVGDMEIANGGGLKIMYANSQTPAGQEVRHLICLEPGEWSGTPPNITVTDSILDTALANSNRDGASTKPTQLRIVNGKATVTEKQ